METAPITMLCAGPGLGFYIPGALLAVGLRRTLRAELEVIERLLPAEKQDVIRRSRERFHQDFRFARMAQKLASDIVEHVDRRAVDDLLRRWRDERRTRFVVLSGFWVPLLNEYARSWSPHPVLADLCHLDAADSPSWRLVGERPDGARHVWFLDQEAREVCFRLDVDGREPLPWSERNHRALAHGGGWGVGNYREAAEQLALLGVDLDVLGFEGDAPVAGARGFYLDPAWFPWSVSAGESLFPPLGHQAPSGRVEYRSCRAYPEVFTLIRQSNAMIGKPGAGTLIDSLAAATPLILLEPCGEHERMNGELWKELGFAVDLQDWIADGARAEVLRTLHDNLVAMRDRVPRYLDNLLAGMGSR